MSTNSIVNKLVSDVATDVSGKWVGVGDLKDLIDATVKECITLIDDAVLHRVPASEYSESIRFHFGIE